MTRPKKSTQDRPVKQRIELVPLGDLRGDPQNPKKHRHSLIDRSISRFGYIEPVVVDARTGYLLSGHGRTATLQQMKHRGDTPPPEVEVSDTGDWLVPAVVGWASRNDVDARAALVTLNRATEVGGWDEAALLDVLETFQAEDDTAVLMEAVGFTDSDLDVLRRHQASAGAEATDPFKEWEGMTDYDSEDVQSYKSIRVHFTDQAAVDEFCRRLEFPVDRAAEKPTSRNSVWFPWQDDVKGAHIELVSDDTEDATPLPADDLSTVENG